MRQVRPHRKPDAGSHHSEVKGWKVGDRELANHVRQMQRHEGKQNRMSEWISVKDRLPSGNQVVLAVTEDSNIFTCWHSSDGHWLMTGLRPADPGAITHWQPLPEIPPKPDAFEDWWKVYWHSDERTLSFQKTAKHAWDAAIASTKQSLL